MPMDQADQDAMEAMFDANNKRKKIQDIPTFYGSAKDTISGRYLIERIEAAAGVAATVWGPERKILELGHCLQGSALIWFRAVKNNGRLNWEDWDVVKTAFLKRYDPTASTRTAVHDLEKLKQKPEEPVGDFYARVDEVFEKLILTTPDAAKTGTAAEINAIADASRDAARTMAKRMCRDSVQWIQQQVFVHGLTEPLRFKVQEVAAENLLDCYNAALDQELIYSREKRTARVNVLADEDDFDVEAEPTDEDHLNMINYNRGRRGLPPRPRPAFFRRPASGNGNSSNGAKLDKKDMRCRYKPCGKPGHLQTKCRMRIAAGAPCVDAQGNPWRTQPKGNDLEAKQTATASLNTYRVL